MSGGVITGVFPQRGEPENEGSPTGSWKKADIEAWLDEQGIDRSDASTKDALLDLVP